MRKSISLIAAIALLGPVATFAAKFEGKVTMTMTPQNGNPMPMTFSLKNGLSRIDFQAGQHSGAMILDQAKQEMIMLMPQQKMYMVRPLQVPAAQDNGAPASTPEATVEKTSEHEKILGYDTTKYVAKTKEGTSSIWITDQLGTFMGLGGGNPMGGFAARRGRDASANHQAWEDAFKGKDAFPLRVTTTSADGKETFRMEATAIDKTPLPDSVFTPPADYQKFDMGNMMRGMMPGMRGPTGGG